MTGLHKPYRPNVLLLTSTKGWHEARLCAAFTAADCNYTCLSLFDIDLAPTPTGFAVRDQPGHTLTHCLPDIVFVRTIDSGSFEQITRRLAILHALSACGVLVTNSARAIERTVDKGHTSHILWLAGINTPPTLTTESRQGASEFVSAHVNVGRELVLKPLFGAQGKGVRRIKHTDELPSPEQVNGVYHLQQFIDNQGEWRDYRVLVSDGKAIGAMTRCHSHWITNRAQGAQCHPVDSSDPVTKLAVRATDALKVDYAGVDIIRNRDQRDFVLEVNSIPAWRGLQALTSHSLATQLVTNTLERYARLDKSTQQP